MWTILAWIGAAAISLLSLKYFPISYLWIFLACAMALFVTAAMDKARRALWANVACISIGLAIFEYYLWTSGQQGFIARRVFEGNFMERLFAPHDELGWAPQAGTVVTQKLSFEGEVLYDATYTIGPDALRVSSPSTNGHGSSPGCILFFGDSFTFGQGLADHQTLPFRVQEQAMQRYRTYNFGVNGYGAHQMLSALQHGLVEDAVQCDRTQVSHVIYQGITDHVSRSAGHDWRKARGPRYVLTRDSGVILDGDLEDYGDDRSAIQFIGSQIYKSMIYRSGVQGKYVRKYNRDELGLYLGIINEARRVVLADYPDAEFHVLWWDQGDVDNKAVSDGLRQRGITVHLMSDILPNYQPDDPNEIYRLHERDGHPNALANELIARYVVERILPQPGSPALK